MLVAGATVTETTLGILGQLVLSQSGGGSLGVGRAGVPEASPLALQTPSPCVLPRSFLCVCLDLSQGQQSEQGPPQ